MTSTTDAEQKLVDQDPDLESIIDALGSTAVRCKIKIVLRHGSEWAASSCPFLAGTASNPPGSFAQQPHETSELRGRQRFCTRIRGC